jgi:hypothetical protein
MKPKQQVPQNASGPVDPQFLGFGIETGSFPDYVGMLRYIQDRSMRTTNLANGIFSKAMNRIRITSP